MFEIMRIKGAKYFVETGQRFGKLTVINEFFIIDKRGWKQRRVTCKCDCGNEVIINTQSLFKHTKSCGCYRKENSGNMLRTHGLEYSPIFAIFKRMRARCYYKTNHDYHNWGGRGIRICNEWLVSPRLFCEWALKHGYKKELSIERIDNNKDYSPDNCTFTTKLRQANNTRNNRIIEYCDEKMSMADFCRKHDINYYKFKYRTGNLRQSPRIAMQDCGHYIAMNQTDKARSIYMKIDMA